MTNSCHLSIKLLLPTSISASKAIDCSILFFLSFLFSLSFLALVSHEFVRVALRHAQTKLLKKKKVCKEKDKTPKRNRPGKRQIHKMENSRVNEDKKKKKDCEREAIKQTNKQQPEEPAHLCQAHTHIYIQKLKARLSFFFHSPFRRCC